MELYENDFADSYDWEAPTTTFERGESVKCLLSTHSQCSGASHQMTVLMEKAERFELMEFQKIIVNHEQLLKLEKLLNDAYKILRPKLSAYAHRKQVIRVLNDIAKDLYDNSAGCPVVEEFGSFLMDLFTRESDLDLSINFRHIPLMFSRDRKIKILQKFASKLYSLQSEGRVQKVQPIMGAKVPILKFVDTATRVECDLSVENWDGLSKSWVIRFITSIDERFMKLSFLIKAWAKAHDINSPKDQTLNSISIILLVAFHLQTRDPPILPPFSAILEDGEDLASVRNSVRNFQNYGRRNSETLGELFVSFLIMLASVEDLWQKGLCASPYLGKWTSKTWDNKIAIMSVEDFMDQTQNVARTVGKLEVKRIYNRIHLTIEDLGLFMKVKIDGLQLKESIFGGPEISWARNLVYHQSMMGRRVVEGVSSTQRQGSTLGRPGWTQGTQSLGGGASTSSWGGASGAAFTDNHNRSSQEMQPATNPEEEGPEEEGFINLLMMTAKFIAILGNSSNTHGPPSR